MADFSTRLYQALLLAGLPFGAALAQTTAPGVGIGTTTPNAAAVLDITSTTQGVLLPRLTLAQRNALGMGRLAAPVAGLLIYQTDNTPGLYAYDGTAWVRLGGDNLGNHTANQPLNMQGNALVGNGANVGGTVGVGVRADGGLNLGQNGSQNVLVGFSAGPALTTGSANVLVGPGSGQSLTAGRRNTFSGYQSGNNSTEGNFNVFTGYRSGFGNTTGHGNTFSGFQSGQSNVDGSDNTALGVNSGPASSNLTNTTAIGANAQVSQSNSVVLGNGANVGIGTSAPAAKLDVNGNANLAGTLQFSNTTLDKIYWTNQGGGGSKTAHLLDWGLANYAGPGTGGLTTGFHIWYTTTGSAWAEQMRLNTTGLGLGTATPAVRLHVAGVAGTPNVRLESLGGTNSRVVTADASGNLTATSALPAGESTTASNGLTRSGLDVQLGGTLTQPTTLAQAGNTFSLTGGSVGIGTTSPAARLVVQEVDGQYLTDIIKAQSFNLGSAVSLYYAGLRASGANTNDALNLDSKGTGALILNNNGGTGNVGIGTSTPGAKLEVAGQVKINGGNPGAGKVLTSDANGLATWQTPAAAAAATGVQNQSATAQAATFRISGSGRVDGENAGFIVDVGGSARVGLMKYANREAGLWRTAGQDFELGRVSDSDLTTATGAGSTFTTDLYVSGSGDVRLGSLAGTGARVVTADASGNLTATQALPSGTDFIQNQTNSVQAGGFKVGGYAEVQGGFRVLNGATVDGSFLAASGNVTLGNSSGGSTQINGNTLVLNGPARNSLGLTTNGVVLYGSSFSAGVTGSIIINNTQGAALVMNSDGTALQGSGGSLFFRTSGVNEVFSVSRALSLNTPNVIIPNGNLGVGLPDTNTNPSSRLQVNGSVALPLTTTSSNLTLNATHYTVRCAPGCTQLTLPSAGTCAGRLYVLINPVGNTSGSVTLLPDGTQTVTDDTTGAAVSTLAAGSRLTIQSNGSNWYVLGR